MAASMSSRAMPVLMTMTNLMKHLTMMKMTMTQGTCSMSRLNANSLNLFAIVAVVVDCIAEGTRMMSAGTNCS